MKPLVIYHANCFEVASLPWEGPHLRIQRASDGAWWDGAAWVAGPRANAVAKAAKE